jgi:proteasome lid subunit RPN8/RPN11
LSYVSIWKSSYDQIIKAATESRNEIIGLLIGKLENDILIIDEPATGKFSGQQDRVVLSPVTIARIADDLLKGRLKGNIVGWYHSHVQGGIFFSQTDLDTQKRFQQFSPLTVGMVVDAITGDVGYFRIDKNGKPIRIPQERVRVYKEKADATPTRPSPKSLTRPRIRRSFPARFTIGIALIALVASLAFLGGVLYQGSSTAPSIHHNPVLTAVVGSPISITADSMEIGNITLFYASGGGSFTQAPMILKKPGEFQYTIPGSQVIANMTYYMEGATRSGTEVTTRPYYVRVSDFKLLQPSQSLTVYRNATKPTNTELRIISINGFSNQVTLSTTGIPHGVNAIIPSQGVPDTTLNMSIMADANAPLQTFSLFVSAFYTSPDSKTITRISSILVTVTDFSIKINPLTWLADPSGQTSFALNMSVAQGFIAPIKLTLIGLPEDTKIQFASSANTIQLTGPAIMTFNIQLATLKQGTYTIIVTATAVLENGDSISHSDTAQLIVR